MNTRKLLERMSLASALLLVLVITPACLMARAVNLTVQWDIPNTITDKGFRYVKKGVEVRYRVDGILPSKLNRAQLMSKMSVAHSAYYHFWKKAGGLKDNQRLVNAVVEASFVRVTGMGGSLFLVVHMYADVVELQAAPAAAPPAPAAPAPAAPTGRLGDPSLHPSTSPMVQRISASLSRALKRLPSS